MDTSCMYCTENDTLKSKMDFICKVSGFSLYFCKNQTHRGRCILAFNKHISAVADMDESDCADFFKAVQRVTRALTRIYSPGQINLGMYADEVTHQHCHIVPKYKGGPDWGGVFSMNPEPELQLCAEQSKAEITRIRAELA